jgi:hypothetical protein
MIRIKANAAVSDTVTSIAEKARYNKRNCLLEDIIPVGLSSPGQRRPTRLLLRHTLIIREKGVENNTGCGLAEFPTHPCNS